MSVRRYSRFFETVLRGRRDAYKCISKNTEYETSPVDCKVGGTEYKKVSCLTLSERKICYNDDGTADTEGRAKWNAFKDIIFGKDGTGSPATGGIVPHLPMPADVVSFFS